MGEKISFFKKTFWDLWLQKCLRNFASVKYQWMTLLYLPVIWGMFTICAETDEPWISASLGLGFLGGGFITLALGRIVVKTKLTESKSELKSELDTDK